MRNTLTFGLIVSLAGPCAAAGAHQARSHRGAGSRVLALRRALSESARCAAAVRRAHPPVSAAGGLAGMARPLSTPGARPETTLAAFDGKLPSATPEMDRMESTLVYAYPTRANRDKFLKEQDGYIRKFQRNVGWTREIPHADRLLLATIVRRMDATIVAAGQAAEGRATRKRRAWLDDLQHNAAALVYRIALESIGAIKDLTSPVPQPVNRIGAINSVLELETIIKKRGSWTSPRGPWDSLRATALLNVVSLASFKPETIAADILLHGGVKRALTHVMGLKRLPQELKQTARHGLSELEK